MFRERTICIMFNFNNPSRIKILSKHLYENKLRNSVQSMSCAIFTTQKKKKKNIFVSRLFYAPRLRAVFIIENRRQCWLCVHKLSVRKKGSALKLMRKKWYGLNVDTYFVLTKLISTAWCETANTAIEWLDTDFT